MFNYPPARHTPHFASQTWITQLLWLLLSLCVLIAMVKPAQAAVEQIRPLSGGNHYIWYVFQPSTYPGLVGRDALSACQAVNKVLGTTWANMSVADMGVYTPAYPYLHQYLCSGTESMNRPFSIIINPVIPPVKAVCPIAMPPFTFNPNTNFCERLICPAGTQLDAAGKVCVEQFTLTLDAPAGDLEPSGTAAGDANSSKAMSVLVKSAQTGLPKNLAKVRITLGVVDGTGGHDHVDPSRPKGTLAGCAAVANLPNNYDCTTGMDGKAAFTFTATQVSGTHTLSASCISPVCTNSQAAAQDVKVPNLSPIPSAFPLYVLGESGAGGVVQPIGWTATHHDNHGATAMAQKGLLKLATIYHSQINPGMGLFVNDASLPWGGVFDICVNAGDCGKNADGSLKPAKPWQPPHGEHRKGDAIDIRAESANGKLGEVPSSMFRELQDAEVKGATVEIHCYGASGLVIASPDRKNNKHPINACDNLPSGRHFHVKFK